MTDIFQEVEEEFRRDQLMKHLRRYGPYLIGAAVGLLVLAGGYEAYKAYRNQRAAALATRFLDADTTLAKDPKAAADAFADIAAKRGGYAVLARFRAAEAVAMTGDAGRAISLLDEIAADTAVEPLLRDLASLKSGYLQIDTASRADLEARLAPLTAPEGPWRFPAREALAFSALKWGDRAKALEGFRALALDPLSPPSVRGRAEDMVVALGGTLIPEDAPATTPGPSAPTGPEPAH